MPDPMPRLEDERRRAEPTRLRKFFRSFGAGPKGQRISCLPGDAKRPLILAALRGTEVASLPVDANQFELLLLFDELLVEVLVLVDELEPELLCESASFVHEPLEQLLERDREMLVDFDVLSVRLPTRTGPFTAASAASPMRAGIGVA